MVPHCHQVTGCCRKDTYEKPVPSPEIMSSSRLPAGVTTAQDLVQQPKAEWREQLCFPTPPVTGSNIFLTLKPA